jgi:hypothetical protein
MAHKKTRNEQYAGGFPSGMEAFETLTDPRNGRSKRHYFGEVLFIALAAMTCGLEGFDDFERFAKLKEDWLRKHLKLKRVHSKSRSAWAMVTRSSFNRIPSSPGSVCP